MDVNFENGTATIFGKSTKLESLINKFSQLSGEQVYHFLRIRGVLVPRYINVLALRAVLNEKIKYLNSNSLPSNYFVRLQGYEYFSEELLFDLFLKICNDKESFAEYRYQFFKLLIQNYQELEFADADFNHIRELAKSPTENFEYYFRYISMSLADQKNTFDGLDIDLLKKNLDLVATIEEIKKLGEKYNLIIPSKLDEEQMTAYVLYELNKKGAADVEASSNLRGKSADEIEAYALKKGVLIHKSLTKIDSINYLFYLLELANFEKSMVSNVIGDVAPLKFSVDLKAINPFGRGTPKKVIYYEGDDAPEEIEKFNLMAERTEAIRTPEHECVICYYDLGMDLAENPITDDLIRCFASLSGKQVNNLFHNRAIKIPRRINLYALVSVLNERVKFVKSNDLAGDYYIRLQYYRNFTEEQYFNLFTKIAKDEEAFFAYRYNLFRLILINSYSLGLSIDEMIYARNHEIEPIEDFKEYYRLVSSELVDQAQSFDGLNISIFKEIMPESSPANEIRQIALKYGIKIPARLNKNELVTYISDYVNINHLNPEHEKEFKDMTLNELSEFCNLNNILMSAALTKTELVTYLFYKLGVRGNLSKIKEIYISKEYVPLEFTVDLENVAMFGKGDPVNVIHYAGEDKAVYKQEIIPLTALRPVTDEDFNIDDFDWDSYVNEESEEVVEENVEEVPVEEEEKKFDINFETYGYGEAIAPLTGLLAIPASLPRPEADGLEFDNWYMDEEFSEPVILNKVLDSNITLHAKWNLIPAEEVVEDVSEETPEAVEEVPTQEIEDNPAEEENTETLPEDEENKEEPQVDEKEEVSEDTEDKKVDLNDVQKNEYYGSKKLAKLGKSKKGLIIGLSIAGVAVAAAATTVILMVLHII